VKELVTQEVVVKCGKSVLMLLVGVVLYTLNPLQYVIALFLCIYPRVSKHVPLHGPTYCQNVFVCEVICCRAPVAAARHPRVEPSVMFSQRNTRHGASNRRAIHKHDTAI